MNDDSWNLFWEKLKTLYNKEDKSDETFEREQPILDKVLRKVEEKLRDRYDFIEPIGRGGTAIVVRLKDKGLDLDRALKIPRPKEEELLDTVRSEMQYLNKVRHENIISIYTLGGVQIPEYTSLYPYFVMNYIEGARDIKKNILAILSRIEESKKLKEITEWIVDKFYKIANAIDFLHRNQIIHFDIKPSNILIDENNKPFLSDLGFAKKKINEGTSIVIGFTLFYAHPDLKYEYSQKSSKNRVRKKMQPKDFKYVWDIYAFGKSLLEILSLVDQKFPDAVVYDYKFVYLHLAACRMLDGRNISQEEVARIRSKQTQNGEEMSIYKETWLELNASNFKEIKYKTFKEICIDFKKLLIGNYFLESNPELNVSYPKRVQISQDIPAPFSERVRYIVEHPVFSRLIYVPQLGLINYVYPTATHNRLEHSIGVFRNCCLYVQSLYNDIYNPLFKQLTNEKDLKCVLLASLLHDLGQYPLAHEIGENVDKLQHERLTLEFLDNPTKDKSGYTLRDIIENVDWGWGIELDRVKEILKKEKGQHRLPYENTVKTKMLSSIIDGPIDVDKLDYLLRDSQNCYLRYGELIDIDRLIRNLTVIINKDSYKQNIAIGTYEKGQSAAESLTFARYLLYQSVYWHHTARAVRCMIREAVNSALMKKIKGKHGNFYKDFEELLGVSKEVNNVTINDILNLIERWTDNEGKEIINMIKQRNYYKRILTIHNYSLPELEKGKKSLLEKFRDVYKSTGFQEKYQKKIKEAFENKLSGNLPKVSKLSPENRDKTIEMLTTPKKIICDCPSLNYGTSDKLRFISEPQRLQQNYFTRGTTGERVSEVWNEIYFKLMNIASKGRVFCHPDIRDTLMAALGPTGINDCLKEMVEENRY